MHILELLAAHYTYLKLFICRVGSKLLWSEVIITKEILSRLFQGHGMTRRERMQLIRHLINIHYLYF